MNKLLTKPETIIPDKFGPDMILALWPDEAKRLVVRGGIAFPRDSGPTDTHGYICVVVRGVEVDDRKAHVVFESWWDAVNPTFDEGRLLDSGVVKHMADMMRTWNCERYAHFENETDAHHFTRQVRQSTAFKVPPFFRRAEFGGEREGWGVIWNWINRREILTAKDSLVSQAIKSSSVEKGARLGPVAGALASALWSLDRRGWNIEGEARRAEDHWRLVPQR